MRRLLTPALVALACVLWSPTASAKLDAQGRPFAKGTIVPRLGFGFGFGSDFFNVGWGAGAGYFVVDGLELGAKISGSHLLWNTDFKLRYPGVEDELPGTSIEITPLLRYVFYRSRAFSPYAFVGVGPTFLTNSEPDPVLGHWTAGPGFLIGIGSNFFLDLGVTFSGRFPGAACSEAYTGVFDTDEGPVELEVTGFCGFRWSPRVGFGFSF